MSETAYQVVFAGEILPGEEVDEVKQKLARLFKKDLAWIERLFGNKPISLKSTTNLDEALKMVAAFKQCGAVSRVVRKPVAAAQSAKAAPKPDEQPAKQDKAAVIRDAFHGDIVLSKPSLSYRISLAFVACALLLLPLLYVALAGGIGYGTWLLASSREALEMMRHASWMGFVAWLGLIAGGVLTILFMFKPVFARWGFGDYPTFELNPSQHKTMFELVEQIAGKVHAPIPEEIVVDADMNASASLLGGIFSAVRKELRLTLGLPLIATMSSRQLAGIIAHELGHFSQTTGLTFSAIINRINALFYTAANDDDPWDRKINAWLEQAQSEELFKEQIFNHMAMIFLGVAKFCVACSRLIIRLFWHLGNAISASVSRQMEFDADRYETHLAGSAAFEDTALQLSVAGAAHQRGIEKWNFALGDRQLVDDFAGLTRACLQEMPAEVQQKVRRAALQRETQMFDSHPSDHERIQAAKRENAAGIFELAEPATWLFDDFAELSRKYTEWHYRNILEYRFDRSNMISVEELVRKESQTLGEIAAMEKSVLSDLPHFFSVKLPQRFPYAKPEELPALEQLVAAVSGIGSELDDVSGQLKLASKQYDKQEERIVDLRYALALTEAGLGIDEQSFRLRDGEEATIRQGIEKAERLMQESEAKLKVLTRPFTASFMAVCQALQQPESMARIADAKQRKEELEELLSGLSQLEERKQDFRKLAMNNHFIDHLSEIAGEDQEKAGSIHPHIERLFAENRRLVQRLNSLFLQHTFPFESGGKGQHTIAHYLFGSDPSFQANHEVWQCSRDAIGNFAILRSRVMARLLQLMQEVKQDLLAGAQAAVPEEGMALAES